MLFTLTGPLFISAHVSSAFKSSLPAICMFQNHGKFTVDTENSDYLVCRSVT